MDATFAQDCEVRAGGGMLPHAGVHRRRDEDGAAVRERRLGQHVVGQSVGEPCQRVRCERGDQQQVGALQVRVRVGGSFPARQRVEGLGGHEALGACRRHRQHVMPIPNEQAQHLARLVGGDAARDAEDDARHRHIVPFRPRRAASLRRRSAGAARREHRSGGVRSRVLVRDLALCNLFHRHRQVVLRARLDQRRRRRFEAHALTELMVIAVDLPCALRRHDHEGVARVDVLQQVIDARFDHRAPMVPVGAVPMTSSRSTMAVSTSVARCTSSFRTM